MNHIGLVLYPRLTQLDLTGPFEVLTRIPDTKVHLLWHSLEPIAADSGLWLTPTMTFAECPNLDVVMVPGGAGIPAVLEDEALLSFLARQGAQAKWVTSVCTGALALGQAGLLQGYAATTHWAYLDVLVGVGARALDRRVVIDRNRVTAGGVTAGIDFGLTLAAALAGEDVAHLIQLGLEYDPAPPFNSGHPRAASAAHIATMRERVSARHDRCVALIEQRAARAR